MSDSGGRTHCWGCGGCWDGWLPKNPEGMACPYCEGTDTHHETKFASLTAEAERLRAERDEAVRLLRIDHIASHPRRSTSCRVCAFLASIKENQP